VFKEEVILLQAIQHLPVSTDRIHTEVLKAILYLPVAAWKDPVPRHMEALLLEAAGRTAVEENLQEVLILQDLRLVHLQVLHRVEVVLPQVVEVVLLQADASLKQ
jgi:hypothetical protein